MCADIEKADNWLTFAETCAYLHVSHCTLYSYIKSGMPAYKLNKLWRFKRSEIDLWLKGLN